MRPSKEIAPQFASWTFVTREGRVVVGVIVAEDREGHVRIGTAEGTVIELDAADIEERHPQNKSIMPERLVDSLTPGEFRDLIAYPCQSEVGQTGHMNWPLSARYPIRQIRYNRNAFRPRIAAIPPPATLAETIV